VVIEAESLEEAEALLVAGRGHRAMAGLFTPSSTWCSPTRS
jgi:hypothetical protein